MTTTGATSKKSGPARRWHQRYSPPTAHGCEVLTFDCAELHFLERTPAAQGGVIWLADALRALLKHEVAYAYEFEGRRYDAGNLLQYLKAKVDLALQRQ